ncbi:MAG: hypothetical protein MK207_08280 [Saprospiraceae bacterium]|nr:hypothetical protein [Saprospiraceae bacterium]
MKEFIVVFALVFSIFFISFLLINIRQIFVGKNFRGTCAQNNPLLQTKIGECQICGKTEDEECKNTDLGKT